jgi:exo-beta-1,3-glucanase (GH17 family)
MRLALLLIVVAACARNAASEGPIVRRPLPAVMIGAPAIAYSGYRRGESPDLQVFPSEAEIAEDLGLIVRGGWKTIRLFDASPHAERVLRVIAAAKLDLHVMQGIWIAGGGAANEAANRAEIERGLALVHAYPDTIVAVSVGNETLDDWSNVKTPPAELAAYLAQVRARTTVPVTTDDSWLPFTLGQDGATSYEDVIEVIDAADFLSLHVYAFSDAYYDGWDWKQAAVPEAQRARAMMDAAIGYTRASVHEVRAVLAARGIELPIVIGEIGWKSASGATASDPPERAIQRFLAHPVNQRMFQDRVDAWVTGDARDADSPAAAFTFEALDEPWKDDDDGWGLFDADRAAKYVLWDRFPDRKPAGAPAYSEADAVYYRAP